MNILFFLTHKSEVAFLYEDFTIRQAVEKMEYHRYSVIPILKRNGEYVGTLSEGDLLWYIKNSQNLNFAQSEDIPLSETPRKRDYLAVDITANIDEMVSLSMMQNFIPVLDDKKSFIGIIKRKDIISYCSDEYKKARLQEVVMSNS